MWTYQGETTADLSSPGTNNEITLKVTDILLEESSLMTWLLILFFGNEQMERWSYWSTLINMFTLASFPPSDWWRRILTSYQSSVSMPHEQNFLQHTFGVAVPSTGLLWLKECKWSTFAFYHRKEGLVTISLLHCWFLFCFTHMWCLSLCNCPHIT